MEQNTQERKPTIREIIGAELKAARLAKKMEQRELAWIIRTTPQYLNNIEAGRGNLSFNQLEKLIDKLGCDIKIKITRKYSKNETAEVPSLLQQD